MLSIHNLLKGNAGTAMRPLAGVLCAGKGNFVLDGNDVDVALIYSERGSHSLLKFTLGTARMRERPIIDLVDGLKQVQFPYFKAQ